MPVNQVFCDLFSFRCRDVTLSARKRAVFLNTAGAKYNHMSVIIYCRLDRDPECLSILNFAESRLHVYVCQGPLP